jgi:hypothetical protein
MRQTRCRISCCSFAPLPVTGIFICALLFISFQRELADLSTEVESLQADLSRLRMQRAEQERGHIGVRSDLEELRGRKGALRSQIDDEQMKLSLLADNRDDERRSLSPGMVSSRSNVEGLSTRAQPNQSEQGLSWGTLSSQASDTLSLPRSPTTVSSHFFDFCCLCTGSFSHDFFVRKGPPNSQDVLS